MTRVIIGLVCMNIPNRPQIVDIKPLESSEHVIFMIACCLNIKPLVSM